MTITLKLVIIILVNSLIFRGDVMPVVFTVSIFAGAACGYVTTEIVRSHLQRYSNQKLLKGEIPENAGFHEVRDLELSKIPKRGLQERLAESKGIVSEGNDFYREIKDLMAPELSIKSG